MANGNKANTRVHLEIEELAAKNGNGKVKVSIQESVRDVVKLLGDSISFRMKIIHPDSQQEYLITATANQVSSKREFKAVVSSKVGYRFSFPKDVDDWENLVDHWFASPQEEVDFNYTKAGLLLKNLCVWVLRNPVWPEEEALQRPMQVQFTRGEFIYISDDVLPTFSTTAAPISFGLKLAEIPELVNSLQYKDLLCKELIRSRSFIRLHMLDNGLNLCRYENSPHVLVEQVLK
jgi:hypothetical protein